MGLKMKKSICAVSLGIGLFLIAGCDTPSSRINKNPELFARFPADVQANIKQGKVNVGYSKDMVNMALGKPNREYIRTTAGGTTEVWSYTSVYTTTDRQRVNAQVRIKDNQGVYRTVQDDIWADVQQQHEYDTLRVEFENSLVIAVEQLNR